MDYLRYLEPSSGRLVSPLTWGFVFTPTGAFVQGEEGQHMFVVEEGSLEVIIDGEVCDGNTK